MIAGIPDFRVYDDPYISIEDDRKKGLHLYEVGQSKTFEELVAYYYSITPEVPPDDAKRYTAHHLGGITRGYGLLARMAQYRMSPAENDMLLDIGCGTGGFLSAVIPMAKHVIGIDIAFRWLVIGRKRLEEVGYPDAQIICACADFLPFRDNLFDKIIMESVIEHTRDAGQVLAEAQRVALVDGRLLGRTVNRFSIAPEPHVGLWGLGFLPRRWMNAYVQWRKQIPYEHIYLYSWGELQRLLHNTGWHTAVVRKPYLTPQDYHHHSPVRRRLFMAYQKVAHVFPPLARIGPFLDFIA